MSTRRHLALAAGAMISASMLPVAPAAAQGAPQVRNAPDFAGLHAQYRKLRAADADKCCGFTAPVFGRVVSFWLFDRFEPVYEAQNDRQFILEFVPQGETVDNWTRMITLSAYRGVGSSPLTTAQMQAQFFNTTNGCNRGSFSTVIASGKLADGADYNLSSNGCGATAGTGYQGAVSGRGEQFLALIVRDSENVYTLQYAERGTPFAAGAQPIADGSVSAAMARFRSIGFCGKATRQQDCSIAFDAR